MTIAFPEQRLMDRSRPIPVVQGKVPQRFTFLLLDGFMMMALASAIEVLRLANHVSATESYDWRLWSIDGRPVANSAGLPTPVHAATEAFPRDTTLVVVGGSQQDVRSGFSRQLLGLLRRAHAHGVKLVGLCTGGLALVEAGVVRARDCAVHWEYQEPLAEQRSVFPGPSAAFTLGPVPTAAGGVAAAELFLSLVSQRLGARVAAGVAESLLLTSVREAGEAQRAASRAHAGARVPAIRSAIATMEASAEDVLAVRDIAAQAGVSVRHLERLFLQHLQTSPLKFYLDLRLDRARRLLSMTDLSVSKIACATGFGSSGQLSYRFKTRFGYSPQQHRKLRGPFPSQDRDNRPPIPTKQGEIPC